MKRRVTVILAVALLLSAACGRHTDERTGPTAEDGLRIASFDFAESELLAELYAQLVETAGVPVVRLGAIGPREIIAPALELDRVDLVPEYLGTALQHAGADETNPDAASGRSELDDRLADRGLTVLSTAAAEDKNVFVVTTETAEAGGLERISDLTTIAATQRFGGPAECRDRSLCLLGLQEVYGLAFAEFVPQRSLDFTAEALRRNEIQVGLMFSTAAQLDAGDLVELVDDLELQPAENIVPVVRTDALERWGPDLGPRLDELAVHLTTSELRSLNARVADGDPVDVVAHDWLTNLGLLD